MFRYLTVSHYRKGIFIMWTVADIMTATVFTIRSSAKVQRAIALMQEKEVRSLIVEKETACGVYGIISERDIVYKVIAVVADPTAVMVGEVMQRPCTAISPHASLGTAARKMRNQGIQQMPVVKDSVLFGVVTITDIVMNSDVALVDLPKDFAERVEMALRHKRLHWSEESQMREESKMVRAVLAELSAEPP